MDLPVYKVVISDDLNDPSGFYFVAFVQDPAIKLDFQYFSEHVRYSSDESKRIVTGPVIVVDKPIYRNIEGKEFYSVFDRDTTERAVRKMAMQNRFNSVNTNHEDPQSGVSMFESYLINREKGISPPQEFSEVPDGSWFVSYHVANDQLWNDVQKGEFKGFSIEGLLNFENTGEVAQTLAALKALSQEIENFKQ